MSSGSAAVSGSGSATISGGGGGATGAAAGGTQMMSPISSHYYTALTPMQLKSLSRSRKVEALRDMRLKPTRNPTAVAVLAADVLAGGSGGLGDEQYSILEQYIYASLELGNRQQAAKTLSTLMKAFGSQSVRVRKLSGLVAEAAGEMTKARDIYKSILKDAPGDAFVVKRFCAMCKSEGQLTEAIEVLESSQAFYLDEDRNPVKFLALHNTDESAYRELLNLYYLLRKWDRCLYYAEEVILLNPYSYLNHVRHAEICYLAKEYERSAAAYAHALTLNDAANNARAAYGLLTVANELGRHQTKSSSSSSSELHVDAKALKTWATQKLKVMYQGSSLYPMLELLLQRE